MRQSRIVLPGILSACVALAAGAVLFADTAKQAPGTEKKAPHRESAAKGNGKTKGRSKASNASTPGAPTGVPRPAESSDSGYGVDPNSTITVHQNENGDIVYSIAASHFDISAPLRDMAANAVPGPAAEEESPTNPMLPPWRLPRSGVPDPVVQTQIPSGDFPGQRGFSLEAPTTGFNFAGTGQLGGTPPDTNGSVGNSQYVETVNTRYQVWSLNYSTKVATSILAPVNINTLWTTFGGACATQNSGDPIVLYDKVADRWLISQFTSSISGGSYFQCVAVSTTNNATGTYARWAFAVPNGYFGDYPHFGVWTDAYYMMAHAFTAASGGSYVAGLFAAMDRPKMLAGNPAATWQVILDPTEGGHMPADLDGFAPPPTNAPGIFLSIHGTSMYLYRMKVDFVTPANTVKTRQATMPVAAATGACVLAATSGTCIPQPGTTALLDSLGDRLMFRAAYRNFVDHESIVISHSVDTAVTGLVSGVRWYDFRLSGTPDAVCPSYPCTYQQGTIADVANGRSRWMPSIAMDGAENILVGYSVSGKTANTENQSIRYTGRAKGDTLGTMTVPEATIQTGTKNETSATRWGDYSSMSVDPVDDCTFWYANEYYTTLNSWSTRIASATWPAGSGAGQCPVTTCTSRPASAPTIGSATAFGSNQVQVTWTGIAPQPGAYAIERAVGACGSEGLYQPLAATAGTNSSFVDTTVQGGLTYSYRVIAATDAAGKCQALTASGCVSATATGTCNLKPTFAGATSGTSNNNSTCGVNVNWTAATSSCPLTPTMRYNIFRGTVPDFVPSAGNRIATCVTGPASYLDTANLSSGVTYYYVVRAEDNSTGNGGECGGGNEESNSVVVSGTAYGLGTQASPGTWSDSGGDGTAFLLLNVAGTGDTSDQAWRFVKTANDAGANHTSGGAYAYRNAGPTATDIYSPNVCSEMQTPLLTVGAGTTNLQYWERHQIEYHWDGVAVEYSRNGGAWTDVPAPTNSTGAGCSASDTTTNWETLSCTGAPPANACGYASTKNAIDGALGSGTACASWVTSSTVTAYAHRCHQITGLTAGDTIQFRWRFSSDSGAEYAGFYLDDIAITNIRLPNTCTPNPCGGQPDGTACNDGNACTQTDTCQSGVCVGSNPVTCTASDQCHDAGTCNPATGTCSNPAKTNGTACNDGSACTQTDTCQSGVCTGSNPVTCTALDQCHDAGTCNPATGVCSNPAKTNGTACNDGNGCTQTDTCQSGTCTGSNPVVCTALDQCHLVGICNPATGTCTNPPATAGTACGNPSSGACDNADTCDGSGNCQVNHVADGTNCGDAGTQCTNQDTCLAGTCHDNGFKAAGTACGDPSSGACDNADTCDGSGTCQSNHLADGTNCGDAGTQCTNQDTCLAGVCHDNGFKAAGTACGDPSSGSCDNADTCDGAGACQPNHVADGASCGDAGTQCTNQDTCLAGLCHDNGFQPSGALCGDPSGGVCDSPDTCDGSGSCLVNHVADGTSCGDAGTECTNQDTCLLGACHDNGFKDAGTACGDPSTGACDNADTCDGAGACQVNHAADGTNCGDAGTECTNQDSCLAGACHDNGFQPAGTACGDPSSGACDNADTCDGSGTCQSNHLADGTNCGDAGTQCTNQDTCLAGVCHDNGFKAAGTACGNPSSGSCDNADTCDGAGACQPNHVPDGASCGDAGTQCTNQDTCLAGLCHDNGFQPSGALCGDPSGGVCDNPDTCDGSGSCLVNHVADGTSCGDAGTECTNQDTCLLGACHDNGFKDAGTACGDPSSGSCDNADTCDGAGACQVNHAADGTNCGDAGTECTNQDSCLAGACHDNGFQPAGTACGDPSSGSCDNADTCDGAGACQPNHVADGASCGDAGTQCTNQDTCLAGLCHDNGFQPAGTACGDPTSGACDFPDTCSGSGSCLVNHVADGTACDDANACTAGTSCTSGVCGGGSTVYPAEVNDSLRLAGTLTTTITWTDPPGSYSVYRGTRSNGIPWAYNQTCHDSRIPGSSAMDSDLPAVGTTFFYVVTRNDACGESIPGRDSGGVPEPNPAPCP